MPTNFAQLVGEFIGFFSSLIPVLFALTFLVIAWGIIKAWIINAGDEASIASGKKTAVAGVIALICMFGIWGILALLRSSLGFD